MICKWRVDTRKMNCKCSIRNVIENDIATRSPQIRLSVQNQKEKVDNNEDLKHSLGYDQHAWTKHKNY